MRPTIQNIFIFLKMCVSLPYRQDMAIRPGNCDKSRPHVVIINSTDGTKLGCHYCLYKCPEGSGLSISCQGENVTKTELDVGCLSCIPGVNYSTGDTFQCKACLPKVIFIFVYILFQFCTISNTSHSFSGNPPNFIFYSV